MLDEFLFLWRHTFKIDNVKNVCAHKLSCSSPVNGVLGCVFIITITPDFFRQPYEIQVNDHIQAVTFLAQPWFLRLSAPTERLL